MRQSDDETWDDAELKAQRRSATICHVAVTEELHVKGKVGIAPCAVQMHNLQQWKLVGFPTYEKRWNKRSARSEAGTIHVCFMFCTANPW